jgi:hypothetical protein
MLHEKKGAGLSTIGCQEEIDRLYPSMEKYLLNV